MDSAEREKLLRRVAQLKELLEKKDDVIRCLVDAIKLGDDARKMYSDDVLPLILDFRETNRDVAELGTEIHREDVSISEVLKKYRGLKAKLSAMLELDFPLPYQREENKRKRQSPA